MSIDCFWPSTPSSVCELTSPVEATPPAEPLQRDAGTPSVSFQVGSQEQRLTWLRVFELPVTLGPPECAATAGSTCRRKLSPGKLRSCG